MLVSVGAAIVVSACSPCFGDPSAFAKLAAANDLLGAHYSIVAQRMGADQAEDLEERLSTHIGEFLLGDRPVDFPPDDWATRLDNLAGLESDLVDQVISGKVAPIAGSEGLVERLIVARTDGTLEPFALYVPPVTDARATRSLVVLLHGQPQTETEILSEPYFRTLADETDSIVAAPYGRGIYDYAPPADDEVYQVADAVANAFAIQPAHVFLAGYSMGGFTVFKIGPLHAARWAGVMCISGSVLDSDAAAVQKGFARIPIYVVNGSKDENIPAIYGQMTAEYLSGIGIRTGFYQQINGDHYVPTFLPALSDAWHDMIAGGVRQSAMPRTNGAVINLPPTMPTMNGPHP